MLASTNLGRQDVSRLLTIHRASKLIAPFSLYCPETAEEAVAQWLRYQEACAFMAGGLSLIESMKAGVRIEAVVHLGRLPDFRTLSDNDGHLRMGAGATLWDVEVCNRFDRAIPTLRRAIAQTGNVRVRMKGTVGGNIMARNSSFDVAPILTALNAQLTFLTSKYQKKIISVDRLAGPDGQIEAVDGLLLEVCIPTTGDVWLGYDRSLRPAISLATGIRIDSGRVTEARVGIACAYSTVLANVVELPNRLEIGKLRNAARSLSDNWAANLPPPMADEIASSEFRRRMAAVLLSRQFEQFSSTWCAAC